MLAKRMGVACGLAETSPDVDAVVNWRTHAAAPLPGGKRGRGSSKAMLTGNFVAVLHAVRPFTDSTAIYRLSIVHQ